MSYCPYCGHKLDGDEIICPHCGQKLVENQEIKSSARETLPGENSKQAFSLETSVNTKQNKKKTKGVGWVVILTLIFLLVVSLAIFVFLFQQGTIPRETLNFLPPRWVSWLSPSSEGKKHSFIVVSKKVYYVTYTFGLVGGKKTLIISSVMEPIFPEKSSKFGAENAFMQLLKIRYADVYYSLLKNMRTKVYDSKLKALDDREMIKKRFTKDGYLVEVMNVPY